MDEIEILKINEQAGRIPGCIRFDRGSADFPFPDELLPLLEDVKKDIAGRHFGYATLGGEPALKEQITLLERKNGRDVSPDDIVVTHGGMSGIYTFLETATKPGDEVIINEYAFEGFSLAIRALMLTERRVNFADPETLRRAITPATKVIIINSPENPTGKVYSRDDLERITGIAKERSILVLSDEVVNGILYEPAAWHGLSLNGGHVVAINSFSKNWFIPGIRVGWSVSKNAELNQCMKNSLSIQSVGVNVLGQLLMAKAMAVIDHKQFMRPRMAILSQKRNLMKRVLDENNIGYIGDPQGGMNFYVDVRSDSRKIALRILEDARVAVIPGDIFESRSSHYVRVGFAAVEEDGIARGIEELAKTLRG